MENMNERPMGGYTTSAPGTRRDRLRARLFPVLHCELPPAPVTHKDVLHIDISITFGWLDRLRLLVSGRAQVDGRVVTENVIGATVPISVAYPLPPKFFERGES